VPDDIYDDRGDEEDNADGLGADGDGGENDGDPGDGDVSPR
jgi:hypothetical protein